MQPYTSKQGMGLIEIVIGSSIIVIGILALIQAFNSYIVYALANEKNVQAAYLVEEGVEAVTFMRDNNWTTYIKSLSTTTTYYLAWSSSLGAWKATTTPQYIDTDFLRSFVVNDVVRDGSGLIASSGTYDPDTKKIIVTVAYPQGHATSTASTTTYIANLNGN